MTGSLKMAAALLLGAAALFFAGCAGEAEPPATTPAEIVPEAEKGPAGQPRTAVREQERPAAAPRRLPVLMYHKIARSGAGDMAITAGKLEEELAFLRQSGYAAILPADWLAYCAGERELPERICMLTFDDGWKSQYQLALPLLRKYGFKAVFYVYPDFVNCPAAMSWEQLRELASQGHCIGSHSKSHAKLTERRPGEGPRAYRARLRDECRLSARTISAKLGLPVRDFCYPYGFYNQALFGVLEEEGYLTAVTVSPQINTAEDDPLLLGRYQVNQSTSLETFKGWLQEPHCQAALVTPADGAICPAPPASCSIRLEGPARAAADGGAEIAIRVRHDRPAFRYENGVISFPPSQEGFHQDCHLTIRTGEGATYRRNFLFTSGSPK